MLTLLELLVKVNFIAAAKIATAPYCETILNAFTPESVTDYKGGLRALNHVFFNNTYYEELELALPLAVEEFGANHSIVVSLHDILSVSYELEGDAERSQKHAQLAQEIT